MSMISYAAGSRYLSLLGGTCMSFYDWYCDLPPASPQTWGEQTDVPESADWYNAGFLLLWGSNVPQTRTPDAHFYTEARYRGAKSAVICPDYSEAAKFGDVWLNAKQGTDAALPLAFGHVILREFHLGRQTEYFEDYTRKYSDFPMLVKLDQQNGKLVPGRIQSLGEMSYEFIANMVKDTTGPEAMKFFPFVFCLFFFILFANLLGMNPYAFTTTSHLAVTVAMAVFTIAIVIIAGIWKKYKRTIGL